jgi:hypothetical protein
MTVVEPDRSSTHVVVTAPRFAVVEFAGSHREVRRVVTLFASAETAELWAVEQGWTAYAVAPASIVTALRD